MTSIHSRPIELIDYRHMMSIILFLHENGPSKKVDIYQAISHNANMPSKIQQMIDSGILEEHCRGRTTTYGLSDYGMEIGEYLHKIEGLLARASSD